jgi:hypothetical protein
LHEGACLPASAIVAFTLDAFTQPQPFAWSGKGGSTKLFAVVSFSRSQCGAPLRPTPFRAPRMRTLRGPSRTLKSLHRVVSTSDVPFVARRHSRVGILLRPICCPASRSSRMVMWRLTYEPEDFCFVRPVRARRASARERLPSYREPASRNPQAMQTVTFNGDRAHAHCFAFWPSVPRVRRCYGLLPG